MVTSQKLVSAALCTCLIFQQLPLSAQTDPYISSAVPRPEFAAKDFSIPGSLGKVRHRFHPAGDRASKAAVVLVEDAHGVSGAQRSIEKILSFLYSEYGIDTAAVEGASGPYDSLFLRSFPSRHLLDKVIEARLSSGELTGPAASALRMGGKIFYRGIEDPALYEANINSYLRALQAREGLLSRAELCEGRLGELKQTLYSPELLALDQKLEEFHSGPQKIMPLVQALRDTGERLEMAPAKNEFPHLSVLFKAENNGEPSPRKFFHEIEALAGEVSRHMRRYEERAEFNARRQEFRTEQIEQETFLEYLLQAAEKKKIELSLSAGLRERLSLHRRLKEVEGPALFSEIENYSERLKSKLMDSRDAREAGRLDRGLFLIGKLLRMELTRSEEEELRSFWAGIGNVSQGTHPSLTAIRRKLAADFNPGLTLTRPFYDFYKYAAARETAFLKNLSELTKDFTVSAVLAAGGFHTEGLSRRLEEMGIPFAVVTPEVERLDPSNPYGDHMRGRISWARHFDSENGRVSVREAFIKTMTEDLLREAREAGGEKGEVLHLKEWRENILRNLAAEGRLDEAGAQSALIDQALESRITLEPIEKKRLAWIEKVEEFTGRLEKLVGQKATSENITGLFQPSGQLFMNRDLKASSNAAAWSGSMVHSAADTVPGPWVRGEPAEPGMILSELRARPEKEKPETPLPVYPEYGELEYWNVYLRLLGTIDAFDKTLSAGNYKNPKRNKTRLEAALEGLRAHSKEMISRADPAPALAEPAKKDLEAANALLSETGAPLASKARRVRLEPKPAIRARYFFGPPLFDSGRPAEGKLGEDAARVNEILMRIVFELGRNERGAAQDLLKRLIAMKSAAVPELRYQFLHHPMFPARAAAALALGGMGKTAAESLHDLSLIRDVRKSDRSAELLWSPVRRAARWAADAVREWEDAPLPYELLNRSELRSSRPGPSREKPHSENDDFRSSLAAALESLEEILGRNSTKQRIPAPKDQSAIEDLRGSLESLTSLIPSADPSSERGREILERAAVMINQAADLLAKYEILSEDERRRYAALSKVPAPDASDPPPPAGPSLEYDPEVYRSLVEFMTSVLDAPENVRERILLKHRKEFKKDIVFTQLQLILNGNVVFENTTLAALMLGLLGSYANETLPALEKILSVKEEDMKDYPVHWRRLKEAAAWAVESIKTGSYTRIPIHLTTIEPVPGSAGERAELRAEDNEKSLNRNVSTGSFPGHMDAARSIVKTIVRLMLRTPGPLRVVSFGTGYPVNVAYDEASWIGQVVYQMEKDGYWRPENRPAAEYIGVDQIAAADYAVLSNEPNFSAFFKRQQDTEKPFKLIYFYSFDPKVTDAYVLDAAKLTLADPAGAEAKGLVWDENPFPSQNTDHISIRFQHGNLDDRLGGLEENSVDLMTVYNVFHQYKDTKEKIIQTRLSPLLKEKGVLLTGKRHGFDLYLDLYQKRFGKLILLKRLIHIGSSLADTYPNEPGHSLGLQLPEEAGLSPLVQEAAFEYFRKNVDANYDGPLESLFTKLQDHMDERPQYIYAYRRALALHLKQKWGGRPGIVRSPANLFHSNDQFIEITYDPDFISFRERHPGFLSEMNEDLDLTPLLRRSELRTSSPEGSLSDEDNRSSSELRSGSREPDPSEQIEAGRLNPGTLTDQDILLEKMEHAAELVKAAHAEKEIPDPVRKNRRNLKDAWERLESTADRLAKTDPGTEQWTEAHARALVDLNFALGLLLKLKMADEEKIDRLRFIPGESVSGEASFSGTVEENPEIDKNLRILIDLVLDEARPSHQIDMLGAVRKMGKPAVPSLLRIIKSDSPHRDRTAAVLMTGILGDEARTAIQDLRNLREAYPGRGLEDAGWQILRDAAAWSVKEIISGGTDRVPIELLDGGDGARSELRAILPPLKGAKEIRPESISPKQWNLFLRVRAALEAVKKELASKTYGPTSTKGKALREARDSLATLTGQLGSSVPANGEVLERSENYVRGALEALKAAVSDYYEEAASITAESGGQVLESQADGAAAANAKKVTRILGDIAAAVLREDLGVLHEYFRELTSMGPGAVEELRAVVKAEILLKNMIAAVIALGALREDARPALDDLRTLRKDMEGRMKERPELTPVHTAAVWAVEQITGRGKSPAPYYLLNNGRINPVLNEGRARSELRSSGIETAVGPQDVRQQLFHTAGLQLTEELKELILTLIPAPVLYTLSERGVSEEDLAWALDGRWVEVPENAEYFIQIDRDPARGRITVSFVPVMLGWSGPLSEAALLYMPLEDKGGGVLKLIQGGKMNTDRLPIADEDFLRNPFRYWIEKNLDAFSRRASFTSHFIVSIGFPARILEEAGFAKISEGGMVRQLPGSSGQKEADESGGAYDEVLKGIARSELRRVQPETLAPALFSLLQTDGADAASRELKERAKDPKYLMIYAGLDSEPALRAARAEAELKAEYRDYEKIHGAWVRELIAAIPAAADRYFAPRRTEKGYQGRLHYSFAFPTAGSPEIRGWILSLVEAIQEIRARDYGRHVSADIRVLVTSDELPAPGSDPGLQDFYTKLGRTGFVKIIETTRTASAELQFDEFLGRNKNALVYGIDGLTFAGIDAMRIVETHIHAAKAFPVALLLMQALAQETEITADLLEKASSQISELAAFNGKNLYINTAAYEIALKYETEQLIGRMA